MNTLNYDYFYQAEHDPSLLSWLDAIKPIVEKQSNTATHGHFPRWLDALNALPPANTHSINLTADAITASAGSDNSEAQQTLIKDTLLELAPWRKGPFNVQGVFVDSEWQSFQKWNRIEKNISQLSGRTVLDVGCGNGYYGYRMLGAGAKSVVGVDPGELFCTQFLAINHFIQATQLAVLPLTGEIVFAQPYCFDSVFSMGVLSHRRVPEEHLAGLLSCLRPGGELVLETLVTNSPKSEALIPKDRYANMRNIWTLPSVSLLLEKITEAGFSNPRCVDICPTTVEEQRPTPWMPSYSLEHALDPNDPSLTKEGYPAPTRAVVIANKP